MNTFTTSPLRVSALLRWAPRRWARPARSPVQGLTQSGRRKQARRAVLLGLFWYALTVLAFDVWQDDWVPHIRDPEYARRSQRWLSRSAEHPDRPVVLVLGSSRVAMGVCPKAWEAVRPQGSDAPLLVNFAAVGQGPIGQVMFFRRLLREGPLPDAVLLEFWPPFLRNDGRFAEEARTDWLRFGPDDFDFVKEYCVNWSTTLRVCRNARLHPFYVYRYKILNHLNPRWLQFSQRSDYIWEAIDDWGWLPTVPDDPPGSNNRAIRIQHCLDSFYRELFKDYQIDTLSERAYREMITRARERGIQVGLLYVPESRDFADFFPVTARCQADDFLHALSQELDVPVIDARDWLENEATSDGFHLRKGPAAEFTQRLGHEVMSAFPGLKRRPAE